MALCAELASWDQAAAPCSMPVSFQSKTCSADSGAGLDIPSRTRSTPSAGSRAAPCAVPVGWAHAAPSTPVIWTPDGLYSDTVSPSRTWLRIGLTEG